jgi:hypothetical protein
MKVSILHHTITIAPRAGKVVAFAYDGLFEWELSQSASEQHRLHCVSTHLSLSHLSLISLSLSLSVSVSVCNDIQHAIRRSGDQFQRQCR